jgi:hypothetical protein
MVEDQSKSIVHGDRSFIAPLALTVFVWVFLMNSPGLPAGRPVRRHLPRLGIGRRTALPRRPDRRPERHAGHGAGRAGR